MPVRAPRNEAGQRVHVFEPCVIVDSREQLPFTFEGIPADAKQGGGLWQIKQAVKGISSGDYSLEGFEERIGIERKSLADLFSTLSHDRLRFERELCRFATFEYSAVVVEADWLTVLTNPPPHSKLNPKTVFRSVVAWQQRYPATHWWFCPDRRFAEMVTFRLLERFWRDVSSGKTSLSAFALWKAKAIAAMRMKEIGSEDEFDGVVIAD